MEQFLEKLPEWLALYGLKALAAIAIVVIGRIAAGAVRTLISRVMGKSRVDATLIAFSSSVAYAAVMIFVFIAALSQIGVQTASFIAVIGAAGLAVGLALQGSLANFASGVLLILFRPIKIGDYIEGAGTAGSVEEIGIFNTHLKSPDNKKVIIPNASLTSSNIINYSAHETRRVDIVAGVSYQDDLDKVKRVLQSILADEPRILPDPTPTIGVLELADSSVNLAVRPWVKTADYWPVYFALQEQIKKRFDAEGISIPFPQQDVHLHQASEQATETDMRLVNG